MGPLVEIFCDGGAHWGIGHLRRSFVLATHLKENGYAVRVRPMSPEGRRLLSQCPADGGEAALAVVDLPYEDGNLMTEARSLGIPMVALDYFGFLEPALTISILERDDPPPPGNRVSGLEYSIIRKDVAQLSPAAGSEGGVLVMIGGADVRGLGRQIARRLVDLGEQPTLIQGPATAPSAPDASVRYKEFKNPANLPELMARCGWAVTNGGSSMLEMLCLGKAVHVVPQSPAEERLSHYILEHGALLGVGIEKLVVPSWEAIFAVQQRALSLVDGRGLWRISEAIEGLLCR